MRCPVCKGLLVVVERESVEVDWCPTCHGIWFDAGELAILAAKAGRRLEPGMIGRTVTGGGERARRCPRCRRKMTKAAPADDETLLLDRCPDHGLWFDAGELGALMERLEQREGEEAVVVGFLNESFSRPSTGKVSRKESNP